MGLIERQSGEFDGSGPEQAIPVESVADEYRWVLLHLPGFGLQAQSVVQMDGTSYDRMDLRDGQGQERQVYFRIDRPFPPA